VLRALPALPVNANPDGYFLDNPFGDEPWPYLVQLVGGRAVVSDLAIEVPTPPQAPPGEEPVRPTTGSFGGAIYELWGALLLTGKDPVAFEVQRVRVTAGSFEESLFTPATTTIFGVSFGGLLPNPSDPAALPGYPLAGRLRLSDCDFAGMVSGTHLEELERADVQLWRNRFRAPLATDLIDAERSRVALLDNTWSDVFGGLQVVLNRDGNPSRENELLVLGNRGSVGAGGSALSLVDPLGPSLGADGTRLRVLFNGWRLGVAEGPAQSGVSVSGALRPQVQANQLAGVAGVGVSLDRTEDCRVARNDLAQLVTSPGPDVLLDEGTRGCRVVVGGGDTVADLGTDNLVLRAGQGR
jgi:hypothetical protein